MEDVERFATATDPVLACCVCSRLIDEAALLKCLHSCCRRCFNATVSRDGGRDVACGVCGALTQAGTARPNGFIDSQVQRYISIAESRVCGWCKENGDADKLAQVWCPTCRHSLCGDCIIGHRQYKRAHVTQSLDELRSLDDVCTQSPVSVCAIHKEPVRVACTTCEQAGCVSCFTECLKRKHELSCVGEESFENYVSKLVATISAKESEMLKKLVALERPKKILVDTLAARDRHLGEIQERKRCVVDAVSKVYEEVESSTKNMYDELQAESEAAVVTADRLASSIADAKDYIRRLMQSNDNCEILNQNDVVQERLQNLSTEVDSLCDKLAMTSRAVKIDASLPTDLENILKQWIGMPAWYSVSSSTSQPLHSPAAEHQQQQLSLSFFEASGSSLQLPVGCWDVALSKDGRRLLAAGHCGLIELCCSSGRQLSRWLPPDICSSIWAVYVRAVVALVDGRAAVSLLGARCVVLLRRSDKTGTEGAEAAAGCDSWTEDRRFDMLPWEPGCLSADGDLLAVAAAGNRLQLLSLSSGQQLSSERQREYWISSLTVAARVVVTLSDEVKLGGGREALQLLDAHSLTDGDERLWRFEVEPEEELQSVCADSTSGFLYAAVQRRDRSSSRVCALSLADGSELQCVSLSFYSSLAAAATLPLPWRLSLSDNGAAAKQQDLKSNGKSRGLLLAVLCLDRKTVTVHGSSS